MRVIDLGGGHDEDYNDEIYDRRGGRGRSRRSDGTYMGYGGGIYDHYGKEHDGRMDELERRERDLERRERELDVTSVSLRNARDSMNVRTRCIAGDGSVSVASVTSSMVPSRICAGDAGVVTTEEQTPMTRIISGI